MGAVGKGASGALGGAAQGAALGSVVPGIGTALGAGLGGLGGLIGGLFGGDDSEEKAMQQLQENKKLYGDIKTPDFAKYDPNNYNYDPKLAQATEVQSDPLLKEAQMNVLNKMSGLSQTGLSDVDQAGFANARELGEQQARGGTEASLQNALNRGAGGSGLEFAMREAANQGGASRANDAALQQAAQAAQMRAAYTNAYGNMAGQVRGQDFGENQTNANILNQFNAMNTNTQNQAQQQNIANRQQGLYYNNNMAQTGFGDQMQKTAGMTGQGENMAKGYAAQGAADQSNTNANIGLGLQAVGQIAKGSSGSGSSSSAPTPSLSNTDPTNMSANDYWKQKNPYSAT